MKPIITGLISSSCLVLFSCIASIPVLAQVTTDGTTSTTVTTPDETNFTINGGNRPEGGGNLFHSFQNFSVPTNGSASFNNAVDIVNIFSRVTGGNISNIDGLLRANGSANLFLINPAGIILGRNARLDIGGSFLGSTADSLLFPDGEFSAVDLDNPSVLTINAPIGLGFRDTPGDITVRGNGNGARFSDSEVIDTQEALRVDGNATIGLIGANLLFEDATIKTAGGRIEIGSVARGEVDIVEVANGFTLDYSAVETFGDISLSGRSVADASGLGGGDIQVAGKNISLTGVSGFTTFTLGSNPGGDINILATESLEISGVENELNFVSGIFNRIFPNGTADGGDINIETGSLRLGDRAAITTFVSGQGNAGDININASESISLESQGNTSAILSSVAEGAIANGGNIDISTSSLNLSNGAFISSNTSGQGDAGDINISATSFSLINGSLLNANTRAEGNAGNTSINAANIFIDGQSNSNADTGIFNNVGSNAVGNGGNISIITESLTLSNRALVDANTSGQGNAGNINVNASNFIALEGNDPNNINTAISAFVSGNTAQGNAGNIELNTGSLTVNNGATLFASGGTRGSGGNVTINTTENVSFTNGSSIFVTGAEGGSITVNAKNLSITSGSNFFGGISSGSGFPEAQSGDIIINLTENLVIDRLDSEDLTFIGNSSYGTGNPGNINISARNITFKNGGSIGSFLDTEQQNTNIGDITLNATGNIIFDGINQSQRSGISNSVSENTSGSIGKIDIKAQNLTLTNGAEISSLVSGNADSGDINIDVTNSLIIDGFDDFSTENSSGILASNISSKIFTTGTGNAGSISITTQNLALSRNGFISSDLVGQGNAGNINIDAKQITIGEQGNTFLSPSFISAETLGDAEGNGGNITIKTSSLFINDGGDIEVSVDGVGNGGNIQINASDIVSVEGTGILFSRQQEQNIDVSSSIIAGLFNSVGNAGNIEIYTAKLIVNNDAFISADVFRSTGKGGSLTIETGKLLVSEGGQISASTLGDGNAGNLTISATDSIELSGGSNTVRSGLFASALVEDGNGGELTVSTNNLIIRDGAIISVGNFPSVEGLQQPGTGEAGNLTIEANNITLANRGRITAATQSPTGEGANITLKVAEDIILRDNSLISARASKEATGGNLDINARFIIAPPMQNNDIIASAEQGIGGNINITAEGIFGLEERSSTPDNETNDIDASSEFGLDGNITINTPDAGVFEETVEAPEIVRLQTLGFNACSRGATGTTNFNIAGKGGVPPQLTAPLSSDAISIEGKPIPIVKRQTERIQQEQIKPLVTAQGKIYPARGIMFLENGDIQLTAHPTSNIQRTPHNVTNCPKS